MSINLQEEWRPVKGYEGYYEVSNLGRVKSLERQSKIRSGGIRNIKEKILKGGIDKSGYKQVLLYKNGARKMIPVHSIVADAFLAKCPGTKGCKRGNYSIDHIDNNKINNIASNLQWLEVSNHCIKSNTSPNRTPKKGENSVNCSLTEKEIAMIRMDYRTYEEIAKDYNVSSGAIQSIITNKTWSHIEYPNLKEQQSHRKIQMINKGEKCGNSKITEEDVKKIRQDNRTNTIIGKDYGISSVAVSCIKRRKTWKHVE